MSSKERTRYFFATLVILICIVLSLTAFLTVRKWENQRIETAFNNSAKTYYTELRDDIKSDIQVLSSVQALFNLHEGQSRKEFGDFVQHLLLQYESIDALAWIPRVPGRLRASYESRARRDGLPGFQFTERKRQGVMIRAGERKEYFPVYYNEPYKGHEAAMGFDAASNAARRQALEKACDTGEKVATERVVLVNSVGSELVGFLVYAPVYRNGVEPDSVRARRNDIRGYVLGVFNIAKVVNKTLRFKPEGVVIYLYDNSAPKNDNLLFHVQADNAITSGAPQKVAASGASLEYSGTFDVAGRTWLLLYKATPAFMPENSTWQPWGALAIGLLMTASLGKYLVDDIRRTEHIESLVKIRTTELQESNEMLSQEIVMRRKAEEGLQQAHGKLEKKVEERTSELSEMNELLKENHQKLENAYNDLKAAQSRILQQEKMASIGQLAAGVAHEINNPVGFITSNLGSLQKYIDRLSGFVAVQAEAVRHLSLISGKDGEAALRKVDEQKKSLKVDFIVEDIGNLIRESQEGTERVRRIVQDLKSFSHTDTAQDKPANINEGLESTINMVWNELKYKATVIKEYGELPPVNCNLGQLNQVFMNLLVNAVHAIEKQGEITIKTWLDNGHINISIADTGSGIPKENIERIFEPFFTTKDVGKGTGLGLSIAYDIVKKHAGEIRVDSEVDKGTTFTIKIPCARG